MTYRIGKSFTFDAAHNLPTLPPDHKCSRLHGHTYTVEVVLSADDLAAPGFVVDFAQFHSLKQYVDSTFDHQHLNKVLDTEPTSENLARHLADWFRENVEPSIPARLESVRICETPSSWAEYEVPLP